MRDTLIDCTPLKDKPSDRPTLSPPLALKGYVRILGYRVRRRKRKKPEHVGLEPFVRLSVCRSPLKLIIKSKSNPKTMSVHHHLVILPPLSVRFCSSFLVWLSGSYIVQRDAGSVGSFFPLKRVSKESRQVLVPSTACLHSWRLVHSTWIDSRPTDRRYLPTYTTSAYSAIPYEMNANTSSESQLFLFLFFIPTSLSLFPRLVGRLPLSLSLYATPLTL